MSKRRFLGAIDQGTSSTRFILFDEKLQIAGQAQKEHRQIYPRPGLVEHDAWEIWENTQSVIFETLMKNGVKPEEIAGIGITNQRETIVAWDKKTGRPLSNALVWQDTRTAQFCQELTVSHGHLLREKTGLPAATYFSASKIRWLLQNNPEWLALVSNGRLAVGTIDCWLIWQLTGQHLTDVTNASRTQLFNIHTLDWDAELLDLFSIPRGILPAVQPSVSRFGTTVTPGVLNSPVTIGGVLGDQQAALFGQCCFQPGESKNTYGTGCFLLMNTGGKPVLSQNGLLTTVGYQIEGSPAVYALEGSVAVAGALVQWARDNLGIITSAPEIDQMAAQVSDNGGVYFVPAFSGLYAPYWDESARGTICGMTRYTNRNHMARAILEATAYQTRDVFEAMRADTALPLPSLKVDGGMTRSGLLMQFQADLLGIPIAMPVVAETTALGAAAAAGLQCGLYQSQSEISALARAGQQWKPQQAQSETDREYTLWKKAVDKSRGWL